MNFLIIGLGSMGKRRIRCLLALGISAENIFGFDTRQDRAEQAYALYQIKTSYEFSSINLQDTDAWIISTPPNWHMHYAMMGATLHKALFIEASVVDDEMNDLQKIINESPVTVFPSCTMRYFPGPKKIKEILDQNSLGKIYAWQYQSGQYLPDWHPWESITDFYASQKETSGCREIVPFELNWLTWIFGPIANIKAHQSQIGSLSVDIDDIYLLQLQHQTGIFGQLLVDVLSRTATRYMRITAENGTLIWDGAKNQINLYQVDAQSASPSWKIIALDQGTTENFYINPEEPYQQELKNFLHCIEKNISPEYSLQQDQTILQLLYSAEENAKQTATV